MSNLQITARYKIYSGKLEEFKRIAEECHSIVKEKDRDTLQYDWYVGESPTECVLRETYPDSNALLAHLGNIGDLFGKLVALGDFSAEVYGEPSQELLDATAGLNIRVYSYFQGL
jgi:quinol monooxygenase YgiN